jgi:hypothetical protein
VTAQANFRLPSTGVAEIPWDDALAAVLGYARETRPLSIRYPSELVSTVQVPAFAYATYDCIPPSPDAGFTWLDVLVVDGLNGRLNQEVITALKHAADRAWPHVERAIERADGKTLWELSAPEVARHPTPGSAGKALESAWAECMGTGNVKLALTHKLLHHKCPDLFPLIDNKTAPGLKRAIDSPDEGLWAVVHRELSENEVQFSALEQAFATLVNGKDDVPLQRLRLHDVLLWLVAAKKWERAVTAGRRTPEWDRHRKNTEAGH